MQYMLYHLEFYINIFVPSTHLQAWYVQKSKVRYLFFIPRDYICTRWFRKRKKHNEAKN